MGYFWLFHMLNLAVKLFEIWHCGWHK